jgi:hypothetical protein
VHEPVHALRRRDHNNLPRIAAKPSTAWSKRGQTPFQPSPFAQKPPSIPEKACLAAKVEGEGDLRPGPGKVGGEETWVRWNAAAAESNTRRSPRPVGRIPSPPCRTRQSRGGGECVGAGKGHAWQGLMVVLAHRNPPATIQNRTTTASPARAQQMQSECPRRTRWASHPQNLREERRRETEAPKPRCCLAQGRVRTCVAIPHQGACLCSAIQIHIRVRVWIYEAGGLRQAR